MKFTTPQKYNLRNVSGVNKLRALFDYRASVFTSRTKRLINDEVWVLNLVLLIRGLLEFEDKYLDPRTSSIRTLISDKLNRDAYLKTFKTLANVTARKYARELHDKI